MPIMFPATGERLLRFVGDHVRFKLQDNRAPGPDAKKGSPKNIRARLRTNLGRAAARRREIISAHAGQTVAANSSWHDVPMQPVADGWQIEMPVTETGYFKAKAYWLDEQNRQYWPDGSDVGISAHPDFARTANTIYCAFTRLFGATKNLAVTADENMEAQLKSLEVLGYATLPPSGKFRDLARQLPHIVHRLGCRIIHLLPVHPTPVTYARFGRMGSPYAALDLTAVDPALVEFDRRTTGIDQFCELTYTAHSLGARVFIDIVINHTGWGSRLQENHPEFFLKTPGGDFASPGAWGTVWEDLVELEQHNVKLWDLIVDSLLIWCRRGVDGFRCDAGYKIPAPAWQYIVARVQEEFPETIFLLEGLGGSWDATELLLTEGGMQWAYSELFQNYSGREVAWYLDYANRQNERVGTYVHYSETHDNNRLAEKGRAWSVLRNRLCALTSPSGGFGFTCGVEWLAPEKIRVHGNTGLNWGAAENQLAELAQLNGLISNHPCFFDGARLTRLSPPDSQVYALLRESAEGRDFVLVLVNTDAEKEGTLALPDSVLPAAIAALDLLGQPVPKMKLESDQTTFILLPGAAFCLASAEKPAGLSGDAYRRVRAQAAFALEALNKIIPAEMVNDLDWHWLADQIERSPKNFLAAATELASSLTAPDDAAPAAEKESGRQAVLATLLARLEARELYPRVITWTLIDARRVTPVPAGHWLLIEDTAPFRVTLEMPDGAPAIHAQSIAAGNNHVAAFAPQCAAPDLAGPAVQTLPSVSPPDATLILERYATTSQKISAPIRFLSPQPQPSTLQLQPSDLVLLTNGRGGMARLCVDLGRVNSKYDCALGANLNASVPVDRHVFVKRIRLWVNAAGFLSALDFNNLAAFKPGAAPVWDFIANAGDSRTVEIKLRAEMPPGENTVVFQFSRPTEKLAQGKQLPADADVRLTVRLDIEDRNFHSETKRNGGADFHFASNCRELPDIVGFEFTPAADRQLRVFADSGIYHPQPEWCENIPHPVEQTRGQVGSGDAYSPGWFELPLAKGASVSLIATAEIRTDLSSAPPLALTATKAPAAAYLKSSSGEPSLSRIPLTETKAAAADDFFESQLYQAAKQFVVRRDAGKTVIAGYPWFLDWGRDSLICARGLLAGGLVQEVKQLLLTFAKFEKDGTLPNTIHGNDVSNRDTSDAPLWFAIVCEECFQREKKPAGGKASVKSAAGKFFETVVDDEGRTLRDVLTSIAENYSRGTPNGIRLDPDSALIWSPSHFTWMDTNYPAGTPREGYPVEIQALWIRLLRLLEKISAPDGQKKWRDLADHATASFEKLFWLEEKGWFADVLLGGARVIARDAVVSDALRSNCLFAVSLGLATGTQAKRCVEAARKYLVVPGGLRTLAPLPVSTPLPVIRDGGLLNDPTNPYWSHYEGDEDTRRKPAYHNGTAWTWTFPTFCEALARAWDNAPTAVAAAKSYLGSAEKLLNEGCLGQLPEILDGDRPHTQRGCDAQAWGATETLRVWKELGQLKIKS